MLADRLDVNFSDPSLLELALTHRSWCAEHPGNDSNERLEFLGDAVLSLVVTDYVYRTYPALREGHLAKLRADVVSAPTLADAARRLGIGSALRLGRGEVFSAGHEKTSILADSFEALVGAVYLDGGWSAAEDFVVTHLGERIGSAATGPGAEDFKTRVQELVARLGYRALTYEIHAEGPDHEKRFTARLVVDGVERGEGRGTSKKQAEQAAARQAWSALTAEPSLAGRNQQSR